MCFLKLLAKITLRVDMPLKHKPELNCITIEVFASIIDT